MKKILIILLYFSSLICMEQKKIKDKVIMKCTDGELKLDQSDLALLNSPFLKAYLSIEGAEEVTPLDEFGISMQTVEALLQLISQLQDVPEDVNHDEIINDQLRHFQGDLFELYKVSSYLLLDWLKPYIPEHLYSNPDFLKKFGASKEDKYFFDDESRAMKVKKIFSSGNSPNVSYSKRFVFVADLYGWNKKPKTRVFDIITGRLLYKFDGCNPRFSSLESFVITESGLGTLKLWDLRTGNLLGDYEGSFPTFSPDERLLLIKTDEDDCCVFDITKHECIFKQPYLGKIGFEVGFCTNDILYIGTMWEDLPEELWDVKNSRLIAHSGRISSMDNGKIFIVYQDGKICIVNEEGDIVMQDIYGSIAESEGNCLDIILSGDDWYQEVEREIWNVETKKLLCKYDGLHAVFSSDNKLFATTQKDGITKVYNIDGTCLLECYGWYPRFSPDGTKFSVSSDGSVMGYITVFSLETGEVLVDDSYLESKFYFSTHPPRSYLTDTHLILLHSTPIKIWDLNKRECVELEGKVTSRHAFSTKDQLLAIEIDGKVKIFDIKENAYIKTLQGESPAFISENVVRLNGCDEGNQSRKKVLYDLSEDKKIVSWNGAVDNPCDAMGSGNIFSTVSQDARLDLWYINKMKPLPRILFGKLYIQKGILTSQEKNNLYAVYEGLSQPEQNVLVDGHTVQEIFTNS